MNEEVKDVRDKFGISESEAREMHEGMRLKFPEFPMTKWEELSKTRDN